MHSDKGSGADIELRFTKTFDAKFLETLQMFAFYDIARFSGIMRYNYKQPQSTYSKTRLDSIGGGVRLFIPYSIYGEFVAAQPLVRSLFINGVKYNNKIKYSFMLSKEIRW